MNVALETGGQDFPNGWTHSRFGDVATLQRGFDLPVQDRTPGPFPVIGSNGVVGFHNEPKLLGPGVIIGRSGTIGKSFFTEEAYWPLNTGLYVRNFYSNDPLFLHFFFQVFDFDKYSAGVSVPTLNRNLVHEAIVCIPPLSEQCSIATVLSKIQAAVDMQNKIVATLKELKAATMAKLFHAGLHGESLKQTEIGEIPESWEMVPCETLCETISVGIVVTPAKYYVPAGVPCFRSFNVQEDRLLEKDLVFISDAANELHGKSKLRTGDVVTVRTGYPGTSCVVPEKYDGANCIDLIFARPNQQAMLSDYLARYINSAAGRKQVLSAQGGLAQQHFNVGAMKRMLVALPSKGEQATISQFGCLLDGKITTAEAKLSSLRALFSAMLHLLMTGQVRVAKLTDEERKLAFSKG